MIPHLDHEASGPSYSVPRLCRSLVDQNAHVEIICLAARPQVMAEVSTSVYPAWRRRFGLSPHLAFALRNAYMQMDVIHNHSLWAMPNVAAGLLAGGSRARLVTSPRGTLSPWALGHSRWKKMALWPLQRSALFHAGLIHATSSQELADVRNAGFRGAVALIPNGVDVPPTPESPNLVDARTLLYLGRIHPQKGIDNLLHSWQIVQAKHRDWRLRIVGVGELADVASVKDLKDQLRLERVTIEGPLYGEEKLRAFSSSALFVLPSHSENFGVAVAEALAHGVPAIVSTGAPWQELQSQRCGWWTSNEREPLAAALDEAMGLSAVELSAMGARGRRWMELEFSWKTIGARMMESYRWLLGKRDLPAWIDIW